MALGGILFVVGGIWHFWGDKIPFGRLPGDIRVEGEYGSFYFPLATCLAISLILTLLGYLLRR